MKKNIKVILQKDLINTGQEGEIVAVKKGYALNYLMPYNIAKVATKGQIKHVQMLKQIRLEQKEKNINKATSVKKQIEKIKKITLYKTTGKDNLIFGNINDKDIINIINYKCNLKLEKKQIQIPIIKNIGIYDIRLQIFQEIKVHLKLQIISKDI
uniref:50S ribosomal protein L9, chloroplastic n=1 Tax=Gastroclonium compressum TaxID=1852973 RepID=A0A173G098_GASCM|nr:ribosomal protein L9 [Coeloseira compressa]ANH09698.1 ribosomal protein L9 [Coeloseira compressa]